MRIIRANSLGMCFGVRDAIALAQQRASQVPLTIFGELVHNDIVLASLRQGGIQVQNDAAKITTPEVMITAHGASERTIGSLRAQGLTVSEATCPLVRNAHRAVQRLVQENYHPVIIGKRDHVEVRGLTEDLRAYDVVLSEEDVNALPDHPRFGVVAQTTQPIEKVRRLLDLICRRFPSAEVHFEDTVCQPTKQRQLAAIELAERADVVVVVGGRNSNNTRELVNTCQQFCQWVHQVQNVAELNPEWFEGAQIVGLTAGTSTPDTTIDSVEHWLRKLADKRRPSLNNPAAVPAPSSTSPTHQSVSNLQQSRTLERV
jgi:4-hydroxy-3-methylbut-2-en-1-yl diphosphate reductase